MSDFVHFKINCVPPKVTAQQKRARIVNGKPVFFKGSKARASEATLEALLAPHQPESPVTGPVAIRIDLTWPWRASDLSTKAKRESAEKLRWIWNSSKPDVDNVAKAFIDTLVMMRFIEDDAKVVDLNICKAFGSDPGIYVNIARMAGRAST